LEVQHALLQIGHGIQVWHHGHRRDAECLVICLEVGTIINGISNVVYVILLKALKALALIKLQDGLCGYVWTIING
jgi:hypothetical protein